MTPQWSGSIKILMNRTLSCLCFCSRLRREIMALKLTAGKYALTFRLPKERTLPPLAFTWANPLSMSPRFNYWPNLSCAHSLPFLTVLRDIEEATSAEEEEVVVVVLVEVVVDTRLMTGLRRHTMLAKDGVVIRDLDLIPRVSIRTIINVNEKRFDTQNNYLNISVTQ